MMMKIGNMYRVRSSACNDSRILLWQVPNMNTNDQVGKMVSSDVFQLVASEVSKTHPNVTWFQAFSSKTIGWFWMGEQNMTISMEWDKEFEELLPGIR